MVHPAFDISKENLASPPADSQLLIEISGKSFNYILYTRNPDQLFLLRQYRIYTSGDKSNRDVLEEIIAGDQVLQDYAQRAIVIYNFPESTIIPEKEYEPGIKIPLTNLVHGYTDNHLVFDEKVTDLSLQNVYFITKELHSLLKEKFAGSQYWHLYTMILKWSAKENSGQGSSTRIIFYNDKFIAAVFIKGMLHLVQTFAYQTPEDAAYYLLLICKQLGIRQQDMHLHFSGLIDTQSTLYTELLKYFQEVNYEGIPDSFGTNGLLDEYPAHYFSPLLKMSLCV